MLQTIDPYLISINYQKFSNERLFLARLHLNILSSPEYNHMQSAYRNNLFPKNALNHTLSDKYSSLDQKEPTLLISSDLRSAFNAISLSTLVSKFITSFEVSSTALLGLTA